jgi:hypothetical protein
MDVKMREPSSVTEKSAKWCSPGKMRPHAKWFSQDPVRGVLAGDTAKARKPFGANALQPDQTDAGNGVATV